jgi:hypothetical protein
MRMQTLSAVDALAQIHSEQGYLVMTSKHVYRIGQVINEIAVAWTNTEGRNDQCSQVNQPVRVEATATDADFTRQQRRMDALTGTDSSGWGGRHRYFYKVVAAD